MRTHFSIVSITTRLLCTGVFFSRLMTSLSQLRHSLKNNALENSQKKKKSSESLPCYSSSPPHFPLLQKLINSSSSDPKKGICFNSISHSAQFLVRVSPLAPQTSRGRGMAALSYIRAQRSLGICPLRFAFQSGCGRQQMEHCLSKN